MKGKVTEIKKGALMAEVIVEVNKDLTVTSVITLDSLSDMNLKVGDEVKALVKAVNVILVKD
jgi:molybdate transport system regulatory protein